jgi:hypothetical protein
LSSFPAFAACGLAISSGGHPDRNLRLPRAEPHATNFSSILAAEVLAQALAKLDSGSPSSRFHSPHAQIQRFGSLLYGKPLDVSQYEGHPQAGMQLPSQDLAQLCCPAKFFGIWSPIRQIDREIVFF